MVDARSFQARTKPFDCEVVPPGDKSLAHRALILAAMAEGTSLVANQPGGADVLSTRAATAALGVEHDRERVTSPGISAWSPPPMAIDCGNSGTTMRLLAGALAGSPVGASLVGDPSLMRRPMSRLIKPLTALGADISVAEGGTAPIKVTGTRLEGARVSVPMASAQVRTAVALAAINAHGATTIDSPPGFRDHTERWLTHLGLGRIESETTFVVTPGPVPAFEITLPGDPSSAAFLWAAAAVLPGSRIVTPNVSLNPGRTGFLEILETMGVGVTLEPGDPVLGDPVGTITVEGAKLIGIDVSGDLTVRSLDELPLLAVVAAAAEGRTTVTDAGELRVKESNRIASSVRLARLAGAEASDHADGFTVDPIRAPLGEGLLDAGGDHRVAMAGAVAALVRGAPVSVAGFEAADVSWPGFGEVLEGMWS